MRDRDDELDLSELWDSELEAQAEARRSVDLTSTPRRVRTRDTAAVDDFLYSLDPSAWARECLGFTPDSWQEQVLSTTRKRVVLNCSRQVGKSTCVAALTLHHVIYTPKALALLISPSLRQSTELFAKIMGFYKSIPNAPKLSDDNRSSMRLAGNDSRIVCLPSSETTVRGFSGVTMLVEDEAAYVSDKLHKAVRPMLATTDGKHFMMSTPFGKRGHFYDTWDRKDDSWQRISVTAEECPRISKEFLAEERILLNELFAQEYMCEFLDELTAYFNPAAVRAMWSDDVQPLEV